MSTASRKSTHRFRVHVEVLITWQGLRGGPSARPPVCGWRTIVDARYRFRVLRSPRSLRGRITIISHPRDVDLRAQKVHASRVRPPNRVDKVALAPSGEQDSERVVPEDHARLRAAEVHADRGGLDRMKQRGEVSGRRATFVTVHSAGVV